MKYRLEIDGLRAIAVLPVIFCHSKFPGLEGGFVGVDVFFVISGYLITTILYHEIVEGKFSVLKFYERRARRILPSLYVVMFFCLIFSYFWMLPDELKNFGQSLIATTLFSNNVLLALTSGYWNLASDFKPLLHTWSLGVEEQYYFVFPLILVVFVKNFKPSTAMVGVFLIAIVSLIFAVLFQDLNSDANYYILISRAWELLVGSSIALIMHNSMHESFPRINKNLMSLLGMAAVLYAVFVFDEKMPYPSIWTLIPTIGTALIIIYGVQGTFVNSLLSNRFFVFVGRLSYSAYLWHWCLLSLAKIYSQEMPTLPTNLSLVVLTFMISWVSYKYIETPFRNGNFLSHRQIVFLIISTSLFFLIAGGYLWKSYGAIERVYPVNSINISDVDKNKYNSKVFDYKKNSFKSNNEPKILVVGNSFARDFFNITLEGLGKKSLNLVYLDDLSYCIDLRRNKSYHELYLNADVIVFSSDKVNDYKECLESNLRFAEDRNIKIYYVGPKHFGYNLNWLVRLERQDLLNKYNKLLPSLLLEESEFSALIPARNAISILSCLLINNNLIPITDEDGFLISADRVHLTKQGAIFVGRRCLTNTDYGREAWLVY